MAEPCGTSAYLTSLNSIVVAGGPDTMTEATLKKHMIADEERWQKVIETCH
jgi:hypothetical protein